MPESPSIRSVLLLIAFLLLAPGGAYAASGDSREWYLQEIQRLEIMLKERPNDVELMWNLARMYYHKGATGGTVKKRLASYQRCQKLSKKAIAVNKRSAEAHFWLGICYGKQAKLQGVWRGILLAGRIKREMEQVVALDPLYNNAGGHRALGRLLFKLPVFLGGDIDAARIHLEEAVHLAPGFSTNHLYLAEVYLRKRAYGLAYRQLRLLLGFSHERDGEEARGKERETAIKLMKEIPAPIREKLSRAGISAGEGQ